MQTVTTLEMLRTCLSNLKKQGKSIALVPTMGALHKGHLALVEAAKTHANHVVTSIFVNPRQFGPGEDLDAYPRQLAADQEMLERAGVAVLWAPGAEVMYPPGYATNISVGGLGDHFCGANRPGHFDGVATVVCKLFQQVQPDFAIFGEKDWQQLAIIRRMARDLDFSHPAAANIIGLPTVRENDGLAMSSRNRYLSAEERAQAASLPRSMKAAIEAMRAGTAPAEALAVLEAELLADGFSAIDYAELADAESLEPLDALGERPARLLVAARIGPARLIDNMAV